MMKSLSLLFLLPLLLGWTEPARLASSTGQHFRPYPSDTLELNPYRWPPFVVARFIQDGHLLTPPGRLTQRTIGDYSLIKQFRFGQLHFIQNIGSVSMGRNTRCVWYAQGRDTMRVVFVVYFNQNVLYDSIPFRPGTFLLYAPWKDSFSQRKHYGSLPTVSFAAYYAENALRLRRQNVFARYGFLIPSYIRPTDEKPPGAPDTPSQIFESVVQRASYVRVQGTRLIPIHRGGPYNWYLADNPADSLIVAHP